MASKYILGADEVILAMTKETFAFKKRKSVSLTRFCLDEYVVVQYLDELAKRMEWIVYWVCSSSPPGAVRCTHHKFF